MWADKTKGFICMGSWENLSWDGKTSKTDGCENENKIKVMFMFLLDSVGNTEYEGLVYF